MDKPRILNLTQHEATKEQVEAGVFEPKDKERVRKLLTFDKTPTFDEIFARAQALADIAVEELDTTNSETYEVGDYDPAAMIGGAPFLMSTLERELADRGIVPVYAFTKRVVQEDENGKKVSFFKHEGFVEAPLCD